MRTAYVLARLLPLLLSLRRDVRRWLCFGRPAQRTPRFHARRAERLVTTLAELGPTFIKMAQVFAGRADLLPEPYLSAISTLADRVPPVPIAAIEKQILQAYGRPVYEVFDDWNAVPVASASLGQVHKAHYRGREVAVKVLRPGVEQLVASDIIAARKITIWAGRLFNHRHIKGLHAVVDEFSRRIGDEMDFRLEAEYAIEIRRNFINSRDVVIPEIVEELIRQRVLVMEFMHGTTLDALGPLIERKQIDPHRLVRTVMELYVQMMMIDGLFHADPHPGNILIRDDGAVILLDFGLVIRVPLETRRALVQTIFAAIRKNPSGVTDGFFALGVVAPGVERDVVERLVGTLLGVAFEKTTAQERIEMMGVMHEELLAERVMTTLYDFPVMLPPDLVYFARTAALIEGLGIRYDARFNALDFAGPIALRLRRQIFASIGLEQPTSVQGFATIMHRALRDVRGVVRRAAGELFAVATEVVAALAEGGITTNGVTKHDR